MQLRFSILLCVDPIVTLLCVKHNGLKVLGMQPKVGRETVDCGLNTAKETTSLTKNIILNAFLMRDVYFKKRALKLLTLSDHLTQVKFK